MIYYLCHNKMSGQVSAVTHFVMRLSQGQRFNLNAIVNKTEDGFHSNLCVCFRAALFECFRSWLGEVLGIELEATVDISCAKYEYTGKL